MLSEQTVKTKGRQNKSRRIPGIVKYTKERTMPFRRGKKSKKSEEG